MRQIVYGDVYFLINASMDFLLLSLCGYFLHLKRRVWRLILSAVLGGVYAVAILLPAWPAWCKVTIHIAVSFLLCAVAYARRWTSLLRPFALFYVLAIWMNSVLELLYRLLAALFSSGGEDAYSIFSSAYKAEWFLLYAMIAAVLIFFVGRLLRGRGVGQSVMLEIEEHGQRVILQGMTDSGNLLTEPLSGRPVILLKQEAIRCLLPGLSLTVMQNGGGTPWQKRKMRIVVAHTVNGTHTLLGYIPDAVLLYRPENEKNKKAVDVVLAVDEGHGQDYAGCAAIVPASIAGS